MSTAPPRAAALHRFYHRYLDDQNAAAYAAAVGERYMLAALQRLCTWQDATTRRAAVLALSFLGDMQCCREIGGALCDGDRGVRMLAEAGTREIWFRDGTSPQRLLLRRIERLNTTQQVAEAAQLATQLIEAAPSVAEAWNQRAVSRYLQGEFVSAARDCRQTLRLNRYHFRAAIGMAECQLEFADPLGALQSLRRALGIHPDLDAVRAQMKYLARALEEL